MFHKLRLKYVSLPVILARWWARDSFPKLSLLNKNTLEKHNVSHKVHLKKHITTNNSCNDWNENE